MIEQQSNLLVATADTFRDMFAVDARTDCEVVGIAAREKTVQLKDRATGEVTIEHYDKLVISPGAAPIRPPLPRDRSPRDLRREDGARCRQIRAWIDERRGRVVRHGLLHRVPDSQERAARRRRRRGLHRYRDGREPGRARLRGHAAATRRPDHGAARSRDGALRRASSRQARCAGPAEQRGVRVPGGRGRISRGPHRVRPGVSGGHRDPRHRRAPRDRARGDGRPRGRRAWRHPRRRPDAHQ